MKHGSLFSGIGGFDLAAQWMGWENVFQVEWDAYCQKVLAKNFPNTKRYGDIREFDGRQYTGTVDFISGGFPCQPFSGAGKRKGRSDDRYLWPEMLRVIGEIKPSFILGENVGGLLSLENGGILDGILTDLENQGYKTEQFVIPSCAVGTWHRRDRIWIFAYSERSFRFRWNDWQVLLQDNGIKGSRQKAKIWSGNRKLSEVGSESNPVFNPGWDSEPELSRMDDGIPYELDRNKGLGNAIVPQVAYQIFKAIELTFL